MGGCSSEPNAAKARVLHHQRKLHKWAKADEHKRFHDLWSLVCDPATLQGAWTRVRANEGSRTAGIDHMTRRYVEQRYGVERFLGELRQELKERSFRPLPARERLIPKKGGKFRRLGISTLRDRVVQMALKLVLEPIFEADFYASSYGYRPGRRTQDAIAEIVHFGNVTYEWVIEADIEACFDEIDHRALMFEVERRIGDRRVLHLIRAFLKAEVMTEAGRLERRLTGTPQGGIVSPLLCNVALSVLDRDFESRWEKKPYRRQQLVRQGQGIHRLIRYADDLVVMVRGSRAQAEAVKARLPRLLEPLGLRLSEPKTRLTHIDAGFDFLCFRIQRRPRENRKPCVYTFVSNEALTSVKRKTKALTKMSTVSLSLQQLIQALNPILRGWTAYFRHAAAKRTFSYVGYFVWWRVMRWLRKKHPKLTWKRMCRRYQLPGPLQENGAMLYNPEAMRVRRYRFRGVKIPTPWNDVESKATGLRQRSFDETEFLGGLQERLVG